MFCPKCGTKQEKDSRFCHNCGTDLSEYLTNNSITVPKLNIKSQKKKSADYSNRVEINGLQNTGMIVQALCLTGYGLLACVLHMRMSQGDIFSINQVGKPLHMAYVLALLIGVILVIYGIVTALKNKHSFGKSGVIVPILSMLVALLNSGANKVYTATSGGSLSGFLGYGFSVGRNGYDPIDEFYYNNMTVPQYMFVAIIGIVITIVVLIRTGAKKNTPKTQVETASATEGSEPDEFDIEVGENYYNDTLIVESDDCESELL